MSVRLIARLDIKGPDLVKGIQMEGWRVLGRPEEFARRYYREGADELIYMDVVATLFDRNSLTDMIRRTSQEIFIPLTVGGGLRSIDDIREVLLAGADKVAINTAATRRPELITEAARRFGSSTIVASIEAKRLSSGRYEAFTNNGRERTNRDAIEWAIQAESLGAGEIMITSVDREGTGDGFDLELIQSIADRVKVPIIACGGAGSIEHVVQAINTGHADAVAMASILHYHESTSSSEKPPSFSRVDPASIASIRSALKERGIETREADPIPETGAKPLQNSPERPSVAIIDCGVGNLASISLACESAGMRPIVTQDRDALLGTDAAILPGVGAFADAMSELRRAELIPGIHDFIDSGRPFVGICLGMQLLFSESEEFSRTAGLGILRGCTRRLASQLANGSVAKVPHVGWAAINTPDDGACRWNGSLLQDVRPGQAMYFSHSFMVIPERADVVLARSRHADTSFCAAVRAENVWGFQFHPERSAAAGLSIYRQLAARLKSAETVGQVAAQLSPIAR